MIENNREFRVAVIADLSDREWQLLRSASRLTTSRNRTYVFEPVTDKKADIYLVDRSWTNTQELWQKMRLDHQSPAIFFVSEGRSNAEKREFKRPISPSSLHGLILMLDELTIQVFHFHPELSIGREEAPHIGPIHANPNNPSFTALVVDDSSTVRAQVGLGLKMAGVAGDFVDTAEKAMNYLKVKDYDIAFLDVVLPGGADGYQICKAIRRDKKRKHIPVIMLTSKSSAIDRFKASLAGCDAFLTKPVENEVFQQMLRHYLKEPGNVRPGVPVSLP